MYDAYTPKDVAGSLPVEVTCLAFQDRRGGFELSKFCKSFHKKAVQELKVCEREDLLLCVSDGQLMAHRLSDQDFKVETLIHKVKPVQTFARFSPKTSGDLYVIVASRKKLFLFKWGEKDGHKDFIEVALDYNPVFTDTPSSIKCVGEMVFFSVRNEYFSMTMQKDKTARTSSTDDVAPPEAWNGFVTRLLNFNCQPGIVPMIDKRRVAFVRSETVQMTDIWGNRPADGLKDVLTFTEVPMQIVYDSPYLVGMLSNGRVEVLSLFSDVPVQTMKLPKSMRLCNGAKGQVFVASLSDIWLMDTATNLRKNVYHLIQERQFEMAIQLADNSNLIPDDQKIEIKKKAALNLFNQKKFDESFALFGEIKTEVLAILRMFPELLPDGFQKVAAGGVSDMPANDRMRALLALGNYLSEIRTEHAKHIELYNRLRSSGQAKKTDTEEMEKLLLTLRVVDTTLLRCYIKTKPALVDSLIRLQSNACTFEDAKKIVESEGRLRSLFVLYETRKKHEMALDLLIDQSSREDADPFFDDAIQQIVEYLQSLGNSNLPLILKYAKWVLAKNLEAGVQIFTSDETEMARNLNRKAVVEFMKAECPEAMIPYLEHVIFKWEEPASYFHETLLEYYVAKVNSLFKDYVHAFPDDENITRAGDEDGELGIFRKRLLRFLEISHSYSPQTVLLQLAPHAFFEERALILGRLKQHDQALALYVNTLKNVPAAEEYCKLYYNPADDTNSQVYLLLFRALVHPNQHHHHSIPFNADSTPFGSFRDDVSETSTVVNSTSSYQPDVNTAIKILAKYADKIDTIGALNMLPAKTPLRVVFSAINAVIQTTGRQASTRKMEKSVSECAMTKKLERKNRAQSTKIVVTFSSECVVCEKKIAVSAFVRYPDGRLAHLYCHNDVKI
ncbi:hypothetical protein B9Z55_020741 [Caenorhabditis nigoni]|uniref:CNH domain-containing protein n=1 Tax=Caenorhabditis nigoni TaxID=1611254 RepID=A0A2G5TNX0_9PELO|nr:hypothetical protein B9Z55_020741 [Caenorhabditis nigoni]